jgi:glycosyltransferase involved in cell wall biosynthesis
VKRVAFFMPSFRGGGAERVMLNLAEGFAREGLPVDIVVAQREGPFVGQVSGAVRTVDLGAHRVLAAMPGLVRYLRAERPHALVSALPHANVVGIWARFLARVSTRMVISEHTVASLSAASSPLARARWLPIAMRFSYGRADAIVAVSDAVADDLTSLLGLDRRRITKIYNPVVTSQLVELAERPLEHAWFGAGEPPVIVTAGRLTAAKDHVTLIRAFAKLREARSARLLILGDGEERATLEALRAELGLSHDVSLPGFVVNPYQYMRRAAVFALTSRWEGFGNVLVEAMACGAAIVSTDCPGGPREILANGRYGVLTPVGDAGALARALAAQLDATVLPPVVERAGEFTLAAALDHYRRALTL